MTPLRTWREQRPGLPGLAMERRMLQGTRARAAPPFRSRSGPNQGATVSMPVPYPLQLELQSARDRRHRLARIPRRNRVPRPRRPVRALVPAPADRPGLLPCKPGPPRARSHGQCPAPGRHGRLGETPARHRGHWLVTVAAHTKGPPPMTENFPGPMAGKTALVTGALAASAGRPPPPGRAGRPRRHYRPGAAGPSRAAGSGASSVPITYWLPVAPGWLSWRALPRREYV